MNRERVKAVIRGAVQGVGFRPFIYRLATALELRGWVCNSAQGVFLEVEGPRTQLNQFMLRLENEKPPRAIIQSMEFSFLEPAGYQGFEIRHSDDHGGKSAFILPDIGVCPDCLKEMFDPANRRYLYPFINCTNCGPRFSIIESLPYDRPNTSMKDFVMCAECQEEYYNPHDRRFHAQPNACPKCGPQLALRDQNGHILAECHEALRQAVAAILEGQILALKGVGGFQLIVDARNEESVRRLRVRKCREEKPFAVMYSTLAMLREDCCVDDFEARLLASPEAPIVLLQRHGGPSRLAPSVAPRNPNLGAMLPSSPLHHLFMRELDFPVIATSGNLSNEPICIHEAEAKERLRNIADLALIHNRPIVRAVDDSVTRVVLDREMILRRARGYAPLPIHVKRELPTILAVGPQLKNTVALSIGREIFVSQHIGDLETSEAWSAFRHVAGDLQQLYGVAPEMIGCDLHPEYLSTKYAKTMAAPSVAVQHHYAHVLAAMAENEVEGPVLGVSWDGTGMGLDRTIWGGEFLQVNDLQERATEPFIRFAHFRNFRLPGGEAAVRQPRRCALGLLWEIFGDSFFERKDTEGIRGQFTALELKMIRQMQAHGINAPFTSSAGRLFDAVASILGVRQRIQFEGQAAMELEFAVQPNEDASYLFRFVEKEAGELIIDWQPMIIQMISELQAGEPVGRMAAAFHNTLAEVVVAVARRASVSQVVLTGGCFQNKYLLERTVSRLREESFRPFWHQRIPCNDGGVALGQIMAIARAANIPREAAEECYA